MKRTKFIFMLLIASTLLFSITGCVTLQMQIDDVTEANVASIQIYRLLPDDRVSGFHETSEPIVTLDPSRHGEFLEGLAKLKFSDTIPLFMASDPSFSYGAYVVRLNFTDGSFRLISDSGYGETFNAQGECVSADHYYCDSEKWEALLNPYLPTATRPNGKPHIPPSSENE